MSWLFSKSLLSGQVQLRSLPTLCELWELLTQTFHIILCPALWSFTLCGCTLAFSNRLCSTADFSSSFSAYPLPFQCSALHIPAAPASQSSDLCLFHPGRHHALLRFPLPCAAIQKVLPGRKSEWSEDSSHLFPFSWGLSPALLVVQYLQWLFHVVCLIVQFFMARGQVQYQLIVVARSGSLQVLLIFSWFNGCHKCQEKITHKVTQIQTKAVHY